MSGYQVVTSSREKTVLFAADELRRCLSRLSPRQGDGVIELKLEPQPGAHPFDDGLSIDIDGGSGAISGVNPRSVLFGVYRYLHELGCRFLFPGKEGEFFPAAEDALQKRVLLREKPESRYRGICIEGANRLETLHDMIDFLPKLGFNSYFIQFRQSYVFFRRWYRHTGHPSLESREPFPVETAEGMTEETVREISKRGLIYHAVGHGWTCDPFGVPGLEWDRWKGEVPPQAAQYFALLDGKRELWGGVPLNTNLCWSNEDGRRIVVDAICEYAREHRESDDVHVWLSDGSNNQCECEHCAAHTPSDWYLMLLNEADRALTRLGLDTKLCFLIYSDLLWPPQTERFENPDRFLLMFAPISRSYRTAFSPKAVGQMVPYERNKIVMPSSVEDNLAHLNGWKKLFFGVGFNFDDHYMWAHHKDAGAMWIADILYQDIKNLKALGLNGYFSCQVQRAMFPNGLGMTVMARALWGDEPFERIVDDYLGSLYGDRAEEIAAYLRELSELSFLLDLEHPQSHSPEKAEACRKMEALTGRLLQDPGIDTVSPLPVAGRYLRLHALLWNRLSGALLLLENNDGPGALAAWDEAKTLLWELEPQVEMGLDCFNFSRTFQEFFTVKDTN